MDPTANWLLLSFNFKNDWVLFDIAHIVHVLVAVVNIGDNPAIWFASIVLDFLRKKILMMLIDTQRNETKENSNDVKSVYANCFNASDVEINELQPLSFA